MIDCKTTASKIKQGLKSESKHTKEDLKEMQSWSLEQKIRVTQTRILEWYLHYDGQVYVSFSGGKDSTVLLDLVRRQFPDVEAVFLDTGLEYPELRNFVKTFNNCTILRPKMNFKEVIVKYGYPVVSKNVSHYVKGAKNGAKSYLSLLNGTYKKPDGTKSNYCCENWKFLIDSPFKISDQCCDIIKKKTAHEYDKISGKHPIIATMAKESRQREAQWLNYGCNAFDKNNASSQPMSFWTEQDVCEYISKFGLDYCPVYGDLINKYGNWEFTGCQRTGCIFCGFGCHMEREPNRFQKLKETHPKQWDYCINGGEYNEEGIWQPNKEGLGMSKVLDYIRVHYK